MFRRRTIVAFVLCVLLIGSFGIAVQAQELNWANIVRRLAPLLEKQGTSKASTNARTRVQGTAPSKLTVDVDVNRQLVQLIEKLKKEAETAQRQRQTALAQSYNRLINTMNNNPDGFFRSETGKELFDAREAGRSKALQKVISEFNRRPNQNISFLDFLKAQEYIEEQTAIAQQGRAIDVTSPPRIRNIVDPVTGEIQSIEQTGGFQREALYGVLQNIVGGGGGGFGGFGGFGGGGFGSSSSSFANSLFTQILNRIFAGQDRGRGRFAGGGGATITTPSTPSVPATPTTVPSSGFRSAELIKPIFAGSGIHNVLATLNSCSDPTNPAPNTCAIDDQFRQAMSEGLTVGEAVERGYLKRNTAFGYRSDGLEPSYQEGYPYRSLVILRKYRILPITWELAAVYAKQHEAKTLGQLLDAYNDSASPYYRLIDSRWVLKVPETFCRRAGPGPDITNESTTPGRDSNGDGDFDDPGDSPPKVALTRANTYCADEQQCLEEAPDGSCKYYGYCSQERRLWKLQGRSCESVYNSCETFRAPDGSIASYLKNTLDYDHCTLESAGCRAYSLTEQSSAPAPVTTLFDEAFGAAVSARWSGFVNTQGCLNTPASPCVGSWSLAQDSQSTDRSAMELYGKATLFFSTTSASGDTPLIRLDAQENKRLVARLRAKSAGGAVRPLASLRISLRDDLRVLWSEDVDLPIDPFVTRDVAIDVGSTALQNANRPRLELAVAGRETQMYDLRSSPATPIPTDAPFVIIDSLQITSQEILPRKIWDSSESKEIYLNRNAQQCSAQYVGCSEFLTVAREGEQWSSDATAVGSIDAIIDTAVASNYQHYAQVPGGYTFQQVFMTWDGSNSCSAKEVGCDLYQSLRRGDDFRVPAVVQPHDLCPAQCVGLDRFRQAPTVFEDPATSLDTVIDRVFTPGRYERDIRAEVRTNARQDRETVLLIPEKASFCIAEAQGCDEFTNLDEVVRGGESKAYFTEYRSCLKPPVSAAASNVAIYFLQQGNGETGFQFQSFELVAKGTASNPRAGEPCTAIDSSGQCDGTTSTFTCSQDDVGTNPDCREVIGSDLSHTRYYVLWSKTIVVSDGCHPYRRTALQGQDARVAQADCAATGGRWDATGAGCIYNILASASRSCSARFAGCRQYQPSSAANVHVMLTERFDDDGALDRWASAGSTWRLTSESELVGSHSMELVIGSSAIMNWAPAGRLRARMIQTQQYLVSFWAEAQNADKRARVAVILRDDDGVLFEGQSEPVGWRVVNIGPLRLTRPLNSERHPRLILQASAVDEYSGPNPEPTAPTFVRIDNLRVSTANFALIKNSWAGKIDSACTAAMAGCRAWQGQRSGRVVNAKSFTNLCKQSSVGCQALINTQNSTAPGSRDPQGNEPPSTAVLKDRTVFVVHDPAKYCPVSQKACQYVGLKTTDPATGQSSYSTAVAAVDPDRFDGTPNNPTILCNGQHVGCQEYVGASGSAFFKDPGTSLCEYRIVEGQTTPKWWKKKTRAQDREQECPTTVERTIGINGPVRQSGEELIITEETPTETRGIIRRWVGMCPASASMCTEYIDPVSTIATNQLANSDFSLHFASSVPPPPRRSAPTDRRFVYYEQRPRGPDGTYTCAPGDQLSSQPLSDPPEWYFPNMFLGGREACVHVGSALSTDTQYLPNSALECERGDRWASNAWHQFCEIVPEPVPSPTTMSDRPDSWNGVDSTTYLTIGDDRAINGVASQDVRLEPNILYTIAVKGRGKLKAQVDSCGALGNAGFKSPDSSMDVLAGGAGVVLRSETLADIRTVTGRLLLVDPRTNPEVRTCTLTVAEETPDTDNSRYITNVQLRQAGVYYALANTLNTSECNGIVDDENGCVLLNERTVEANPQETQLVRNGSFEELTTVEDGEKTLRIPASWRPGNGITGSFVEGPGLNGSPWAAVRASQRVSLTAGVLYELKAYGTRGLGSADHAVLYLNECESELTRFERVGFKENTLPVNQFDRDRNFIPTVYTIQLNVAGRKKLFGGTFRIEASGQQPVSCSLSASAPFRRTSDGSIEALGMVDGVSLTPVRSEAGQRLQALTHDANATIGTTGASRRCTIEESQSGCQSNSNVLTKATADRTCKQWLACRSAIEAPDAKGNKQNLCFQVSACTQLGPNGECQNFKVEDQERNIVRREKADQIANNTGYTTTGLRWPYSSTERGFSPTPFASSDLYQGYGWYPVSQMAQIGSIVRIPNGGFEDVANTGQPLHWKTTGGENDPFAPAWTRGLFQGINNPMDAQKEGVKPYDGIGYVAVRGENIAASNQLDVFGNTKYVLSVAMNTIALKGGANTDEQSWAQVFIEQYDERQQLIVSSGCQGSEANRDYPTPSALRLAYGMGWTVKDYRFRTCNNARFLTVKLSAFHPQGCRSDGGPQGCDPLKKPEGSTYFDSVQIAPVLEVASDGRRQNFINPADVVRSCRLYPKEEAPSCLFRDAAGVRHQGFEGYCLVRDPNNPAVCLQWYPVDIIAGNEYGETAVDYSDKAPLYYCSEMKIFETRAYWRAFTGLQVRQGFGFRSLVSAGAAFFLPSSITGFVNGWQKWTAALGILANSGGGTPEQAPMVLCAGDPGYNAWLETQEGSFWTGRDVIRSFCQARGEVIFTTPNPEIPQIPLQWYEYNGTQVEINENDTRPERANKPAPTHFVEEIKPFCTKITKVVQSDGSNKAWFSRLNEGGLKFVQDLGYTYGYDTLPFGAVAVPDEGDPDNPTTWKLETPLPITDDQSVARGGAPYACSNYSDTTLGVKAPVCQMAALHGVLLSTPEGRTPYPTGGLESCSDAAGRLKHLYWGNYGTWEWGGKCVPNTYCTNPQTLSGDRPVRKCASDAQCGFVADHQRCEELSRQMYCSPDPNDPTKTICVDMTLGAYCEKSENSEKPVCAVCLWSNGPAGSCTVPGGQPAKVCAGGILNGQSCVSDINCRGTGMKAGYVPLAENQCNWTKPVLQCPGNKRPQLEFAYCKGANDNIYGASGGAEDTRGKCVGGPRNGLACLTRDPSDPSKLAPENQGCPAGITTREEGSFGDFLLPKGAGTTMRGNGQTAIDPEAEYCAVAPAIGSTRVSPLKDAHTVEVKTSGFVTLKFTSIVDPNQLPVTAYKVRWGDGEESTLSGVEIRNRPNIDNPHTLFHLFSYWDMVQKQSQGRLPAGTCDTQARQCRATITIQVRDKWGWCNTDDPTRGETGEHCSPTSTALGSIASGHFYPWKTVRGQDADGSNTTQTLEIVVKER